MASDATDSETRGRKRVIDDYHILLAINTMTEPDDQHPVVGTGKIAERLPMGGSEEKITSRQVRNRLDDLRDHDPSLVDRKMIGGTAAWYLTEFGRTVVWHHMNDLPLLHEGEILPIANLLDHFDESGNHYCEGHGRTFEPGGPGHYEEEITDDDRMWYYNHGPNLY